MDKAKGRWPTCTPTRKFDWKLFAWWVLANAMGLALGIVGIVLTQWLVLRRWVPWVDRWATASSVGLVGGVALASCPFIVLVSIAAVLPGAPYIVVGALTGVAVGIILGTIQGACQRYSLKRECYSIQKF